MGNIGLVTGLASHIIVLAYVLNRQYWNTAYELGYYAVELSEELMV